MRRCHHIAILLALTCVDRAMAQPPLPDGPGKPIVEQACLSCHEPVRILNAGYSRADWENVLHMMQNVGAPLRADQVASDVAAIALNALFTKRR